MTEASKRKHALMATFGSSLEVAGVAYPAFPEPEQMALASPEQLLTIANNERKAEYVRAVAHAFAGVDEDFLATGEYEKVKAWLLKIRGIGQWSASFVMLRSLGRTDHVPIEERRLLEAASLVYWQGQSMSQQELEQLAQPYGSWQGYWAHYLRTFVSLH